ncbi:WhiB family transcriptional regulator (plasmid) [Streptomycetaceae bacterium NBC_01309]
MSGHVRIVKRGVRIEARWQDDAACLQVGPDLFTAPDDEKNSTAKSTRERWAKQVCAGCPVRALCLEDAIASGDRWSVRGGLTPEEREQLTSSAAA